MAIAAIAGLATIGGAMAAATTFAIGFTAAATAFAIGAGLSVISRALMPKPDFGAMMQGVTGTVREATASRKVIYGKVRVGGAVVFIANSNENKDLYLVICFACHEIEGYEAVYFNDKKVYENGAYLAGYGSYADFAFYDGTQTAADPVLSSASVNWGATHILNGIAYMRVKLTWDPDRKKYPQGVPNISAVIKGKPLYDPRKDSTAGGSGSHRTNDTTTWEWSQNPALALYDYFTNSFYGLGESYAKMDYTAWTGAANVCDESITLDAGGTHARYECDGVIDTANAIKGNIEALTACMGGRIGYVDGKYFAQAAKYYTPTITIDESHMVGAITIQTKQSRRSMYNAVKGTFLSEEKNYTLVDYPAKISSSYATADGDPIYLDMPLPFVTNNIRAQRLAKIALLKSRQQVLINVPLNLAGLKFKAGDFIGVTNSRMGYSNKPFEVIGYDLKIGGDGAIIVNVQAIETDTAVYDWTASSDEDAFNIPSDPTVNDGTTVGAPQAPLILSEYTQHNSDGSTVTGLKIGWSASNDGFIEYYEVEVIDNIETTSKFFNTTTETGIQIAGLRSFSTIGITYNVKVRAVNSIGVRSADLTGSISMTGDTTAPANPTNLTGTAGAKGITFTWTNPTDDDFKHMRVFIDDDTSQPSTPTAIMDGEEYFLPVTIASGQTSATRYCWIQPEDFSGNRGNIVGAVSATVNLLNWNDILASSITAQARYSYEYSTSDVSASSIVAGTLYKIMTVGTSDFTLIGASANTVGRHFYATGSTSGTGTVRAIRTLHESFDGHLLTMTLPAPSDTSLPHKPYLRIVLEWETSIFNQPNTAANWEDDGGDKPEIEWFIRSVLTTPPAGTVYTKWHYLHPIINDTSADRNIHTHTIVVAFPERSTDLTVYWFDQLTNFDIGTGEKGFYRRWEVDFVGTR